MSHPIDPPAPPDAGLLAHRIHRATDALHRGAYEPATAARLGADALALALAAGLPDEHRLLADLTAARAAFAAGDADAGRRVIRLAGQLSTRIAEWGTTAYDTVWRADRDQVAQRPRTAP